jgi:hypothetical protein
MADIQKSPIGWGDLNKALNGLVQAKVIQSYRTQKPGKNAELNLVEVTVEVGADQADVVRRVREALPEAFSGLQIRTRTT